MSREEDRSGSDCWRWDYIYAELFPEPRPARSTIVVAALARPGLLVEIEAIAYRSTSATGRQTGARRVARRVVASGPRTRPTGRKRSAHAARTRRKSGR